jgi:hypothetical protein
MLWISIPLAVVIVLLAVGIPYWYTHKRMAHHYDHSQGEAYLAATGKTREDAALGRPGRPSRRRGTIRKWPREPAGRRDQDPGRPTRSGTA